MSRYYCPFCSSRNQIHKTNRDGVLICGQCDEPLLKKTLINSRQIFGFVTSLAFLVPLLLMIVFIYEDFTNEKVQKDFETSVLLNIK